MSIFFTENERSAFKQSRLPVCVDARWAIQRRADRRAEQPGLIDLETDVEWWYAAYDYVVDAAMSLAVSPDEHRAAWLRATVLELARRPVDDWIGPWFRGHADDEPVGHLETAHLSWACSIALDVCPDCFSEAEQDEIRTVLRERAMPMCWRWLKQAGHLANWRCILLAGATLPAAVLGDRAELERCAAHWRLAVECFEEDGTYGESLQYSHYAMYGLMLAWEALHRCDPALTEGLSVERYARGMRWHAASLLYKKPLGGGWGAAPRPRSLNFNDSGSVFAPSPEVLLHIMRRCADSLPEEAALARWILETWWCPVCDPGPNDRSSFGFVPTWGGLALPSLGSLDQLPAAQSPAALGLDAVQAFDNGDTVLRDDWQGQTIIGMRGGGSLLHCSGHQHADLGSFILAHRDERLLVDPGHSCYRGAIHRAEMADNMHSTCCFQAADDPQMISQSWKVDRRLFENEVPGPCIDRGSRRLVCAEDGPVRVIGNEIAAAYGEPIERFARYCILAGSGACFIVDHIRACAPVRTTWNWVLNNRNDTLDLKVLGDRLVARRGQSGFKLFQGGAVGKANLAHGWVHDAYHPQPNQLGEGVSGSASILRWQEQRPATERWVVTSIAVDSIGAVAGWHLCNDDAADAILESPGASERWRLRIDREQGRMHLDETVSAANWCITEQSLERS